MSLGLYIVNNNTVYENRVIIIDFMVEQHLKERPESQESRKYNSMEKE